MRAENKSLRRALSLCKGTVHFIPIFCVSSQMVHSQYVVIYKELNNNNNNNIAFILRKFHVYNMFKCALHDTYNYTLNILRVLFGAFSCHSRNTGASPFSFYDKCPGFFYVHYTTHGTHSFTSHPKDEAIMVKCLAQGHKCHDRDSNPHSAANTRT